MTYPELRERVALVSGAASGIGAATVTALRAEGMRVAACDIADMAADPHSWRLDVTDPDSVAEVVTAAETDLGAIDVLVNVAGVLRPASLMETALDDWSALFEVNTTGVFLLTRQIAAGMSARQRGSVVTVTSNAAGVPRQHIGAYAASKAASTHLTRCFGLELAAAGVRCNVVAPGSTRTPMLQALWADNPVAEESTIYGDPESHRGGIPLGKIAQPSDIAATVAFLASDAAAHLTMQELYVDGGASLR